MPSPNRQLRGKFAIAAVGNTRYGDHEGVGSNDLLVTAMHKAVTEAGLAKGDIDGLVTQASGHQYTHHALIGELLGLDTGFSTTVENGGASQVMGIIVACMAIEAGLCDTVLCGYGTDDRSRSRKGMAAPAVENGGMASYRAQAGYFGEVGTYALGARRHMEEFGSTRRQLAAIAVSARRHATRNPDAQFRQAFDIEEHLAARSIVDPFGLLDCSPLSDGAGAVVVTSAERARSMRQRPAYILGFGSASQGSGWLHEDNMIRTAAGPSASGAYNMAGVGPADMDCAQLYDPFTYMTLVQLEDYGFCGKGEGGAFAASGALDLGGSLPTNTAGGLLSEGHVAGIGHVIEAVRQVRRSHEPARQVPDAELCIVSGHGGRSVCHASIVVGREAG